MNKTQWGAVPEKSKTEMIDHPWGMIEFNVVPVRRAKEVAAGWQLWGDDDYDDEDEKDAVCVCDGGHRNGWSESG
ncbi:MAG: hypothetical protein K9N55_10730, partial [Phycisphaerae bacterium]|nr:hypothetical protein [Phycisphaerae bacterium]